MSSIILQSSKLVGHVISEEIENKPVGDMDLREFISVLRLDLYKYGHYATGQKPCDNPQMRSRYGNHRTTWQFPCELLNIVLVD